MTIPFTYSTTYVLDKSHFSETFDESKVVDNTKNLYLTAILIGCVGAVLLLFTELDPYVSWFIIALGGLEAFSVRFRKSWWLGRQLMSKAANTELTLTIDENGVSSKSLSVESTILWTDIKKIEQTTQGWLLHLAVGKSYLSNRILSDAAKQFINTKAELIN
jgi:hypothetical protein